MAKTISASEAKTNFGTIVNWAVQKNEEVIIQSYGEPKAVIISFAEFQKLAQLREQERRRQALAAMEQLRTEVSARNQDLSENQVDALADQVVRQSVQNLLGKKQDAYAD
ncbi:MAG: type II toxin-antitoxin system Phd/YefM family antitoxin [Chloroflexota bacterium]|nr:type II toxin-antitoxin system Phd/YefM family antitoxin [Chloroflexota bacterium]